MLESRFCFCRKVRVKVAALVFADSTLSTRLNTVTAYAAHSAQIFEMSTCPPMSLKAQGADERSPQLLGDTTASVAHFANVKNAAARPQQG